MVSHRREVTISQILSNGFGTSESPTGILGRVFDCKPTPSEWGSGLHLDYQASCLLPTEGSMSPSPSSSLQKGDKKAYQ
jgi:hypothetical protein